MRPPRKAKPPHKDLDGKKRDDVPHLDHGVWVGNSSTKPRYIELYMEGQELPWVFTLSCWHRRRKTYKFKTEELRNERAYYLKVNSCKSVDCPEIGKPVRRSG